MSTEENNTEKTPAQVNVPINVGDNRGGKISAGEFGDVGNLQQNLNNQQIGENSGTNIGTQINYNGDHYKAALEEAARVDPFNDDNPPLFGLTQKENRFFTGREAILSDVNALLLSEGSAVLSGLGGVGKTQIAIEYAYRHQKDYRLVFLINASSELAILTSYKELANSLKLPERSLSDLDAIKNAVISKLNTDPRWLLVFDNADGEGSEQEHRFIEMIEALLPQGGHVIITSRLRDWERIAKTIHVDVLKPEESVAFLHDRTGHKENADALAEALGHLPLALEQAAAYVRKRKIDLGEYLNRFEEGRKTFNYRVQGYEETIYTTWSLSVDKISEEAAEDILKISALLAPDRIPRRLFEGRYDEEEVEEALAALDGYSLIKLEADHFSVHRLLQYVLREEEKWQEVAVGLVSGMYPGWEFEHWAELEVLLPHAQALLEKETLESEEEALLAGRFGNYLNERGRYEEAEPLYDKALKSYQRLLGQEHPDTLTSMNNLAELYKQTGRYEKAEPLDDKALKSYQRLLGQEHPDTLTSMNNLAELYKQTGRYEKAEPLYEKALELCRSILGQEHPLTLTSMNNLAALYDTTGRYEEAEPLYEKTLELRRSILGDEHPDTLNSMNNLAGLYRQTGRYEQAEPLYEKTLELRRSILGEEHPDTLNSMNNLALLYDNTGRYEEAEPLYEKTLELRRSILGQEHPHTLLSMNNLALLYNNTGRYEQAEPLYEKTLEGSRKVLGEEHPSTLSSMNNLALLYNNTGRYEEAEPLYEKTLELRRSILGEEHPYTLTSMNNLAKFYFDLGDLIKESLLLRAAQGRLNVLGPEHPDTQDALLGLQMIQQMKEGNE